MNLRWRHSYPAVALLLMLLLIVATACSSGDDDDSTATESSTATTVSGSTGSDASPTTDAADATATSGDADASATATDTARETATATNPAEATATKADSTKPTATATTSGTGSSATEPASASSTATSPSDGGTADIPEIETLDPELLPNFSMTMDFDAVNLSGTPQTTLKMEMQQSAIDHYHLFMETDGEELEFWTIDEQSWTTIAGETIESPTGPLFSPADILTTGELIPEGLEARNEGTEEVNGRQTTKWVVDGADYVEYMNEEGSVDGITDIEMTDGSGEVTIWIDNELNIMIKADGDVAWKNSDDTDGSLIYTYEIHDIGSTADVQAPQ